MELRRMYQVSYMAIEYKRVPSLTANQVFELCYTLDCDPDMEYYETESAAVAAADAVDIAPYSFADGRTIELQAVSVCPVTVDIEDDNYPVEYGGTCYDRAGVWVDIDALEGELMRAAELCEESGNNVLVCLDSDGIFYREEPLARVHYYALLHTFYARPIAEYGIDYIDYRGIAWDIVHGLNN